MPAGTLTEKILSRISEDANGCWVWQGSVDTRGYAHMRANGKTQRVHRVAYRLWVADLPDGPGTHAAVVMHICDNRRCCNPAHLKLGAQKENVADMEAKGRAVHYAGEMNGRAVLTAGDVERIRRDPRGTRTIAKEYPVSRAAVQRIKTGKAWSCLVM